MGESFWKHATNIFKKKNAFVKFLVWIQFLRLHLSHKGGVAVRRCQNPGIARRGGGGGGGDKNIDIDGYSKTSPKYSIVKDKAQCFT